MQATALAQAAMEAWEPGGVNRLASLLSDDFVCWGVLPHPAQKVQYIDFVQAIITAMPDWSFHAHFLYERPLKGQGQSVLFVTQIMATHTHDLVLPDLPVIPPTGTKISIPYRHSAHPGTGSTYTTTME